MFDFIKNLFKSVPTFGTGAFENAPDTRDIPYSAVAPTAITTPKEYKTDLSMFAVFNQMSLGTCVAHAFVLVKMWLDWKETGKVVTYSRRKFYSYVRKFAGMLESFGQGLMPRDGAKVAVNYGFNEDVGVDDNTLSHASYVAYSHTDADRKEADKYRAKGYAFVNGADPEEICQAIVREGLVMVSIPSDKQVSFSSWWVKVIATVVSFFTGRHYIVFYGYEKKTKGSTILDYKFFFRNSWGLGWGKKGDGYVTYSNMGKYLLDLIVLTDLPNDVIERAKQAQYIFIRDLKKGMQGDDVRQLQIRLKDLGLFDAEATAYFGDVTFRAVVEYQKLKGLPETGFFGSMSREKMNADSVKPKSKLDLWIEGIAQFEQAKPELNNIGNIKCSAIMHQDAVGMDYRGLCIFPTYEKGYNALKTLLVRASTGKSQVYNPEMTIHDFFMKYAPPSDNNPTSAYANYVAKHIGVPVTTKIKTLV